MSLVVALDKIVDIPVIVEHYVRVNLYCTSGNNTVQAAVQQPSVHS